MNMYCTIGIRTIYTTLDLVAQPFVKRMTTLDRVRKLHHWSKLCERCELIIIFVENVVMN